MKSLLVIAFLTASFSSFGAGYVNKNFYKYFYATTEAELVAQVETAIPGIEAGEDKDLNRSMRFQRCQMNPRYINVGKLYIKKIYSKEDGVLVSKFKGILTVSNRRCFESNK